MTNASHTAAIDPVFFGFTVFWVALGLAAFAFFYLNRDAELKRRIFPFYIGGLGVISVIFVGWLGGWQPVVLMITVPLIGLNTFLSLRTTKFCSGCGRTLFKQPLLSPAKICRHCGSSLDPADGASPQSDLPGSRLRTAGRVAAPTNPSQ